MLLDASVKKYYEDHRIFERMDRLKKQPTRMSTKQVRCRINDAPDRDMGRAMLNAEKQLRPPPRQYAAWSPDLREAGLLNFAITGNPVFLTSARNPIFTALTPRDPTTPAAD